MSGPVRQTSIRVYREIKANGLLSALRFRIYRILFRHGPLTANEVAGYFTGKQPHVYNRLSELRMQGVAQVVGERVCRVTGLVAQIWDVTDQLPKRFKRQRSKASQYRDILVAEIARHKASGHVRTAKRLRLLVDSVSNG